MRWPAKLISDTTLGDFRANSRAVNRQHQIGIRFSPGDIIAGIGKRFGKMDRPTAPKNASEDS